MGRKDRNITVGGKTIVHKKDGSVETTNQDGTVEITPAPEQQTEQK